MVRAFLIKNLFINNYQISFVFLNNLSFYPTSSISNFTEIFGHITLLLLDEKLTESLSENGEIRKEI